LLTRFQAAKDEALLDDGSTICLEDRSPLGQVLLRLLSTLHMPDGFS